MATLKSSQRQTVRSILEQYGRLSTVSGREMFLYDAGLEALIPNLQMGEDTATFCFKLVQLCEAPRLVNGQDAVVLLIEHLRMEVVSGHYDLVAQLNDILKDIQSPTGVVSPTVTALPTPIKILFFSANSTELSPLKLDIEMRSVGEHLQEGNVRDKFELKLEPATRDNKITSHLLRYRPTIVHFAGHGVKDSGIWLNNARDESVLLAPDVLAGLFDLPDVQKNLHAIVINACWSEAQAKALSTIARVPYVIGMNQPIPDRGAHAFSGGFYRGLGFNMDIPSAFQLGRKELAREMNDADFQTLPQLLEYKG